MKSFKTVLKIANILCLIACIIEFMYIDYGLSYTLNYLFTFNEFDSPILQLSSYIIFYYITVLCFIVAEINLILLSYKKLKLSRLEFLSNQNLYIWLIIITGALMVLSSIITKLFFIIAFVLLVVGISKVNKQITIDEKAKQDYNNEIAIIESLYKSNYIDENKMVKLKDDVFAKYYSKKEGNLKSTNTNVTDLN